MRPTATLEGTTRGILAIALLLCADAARGREPQPQDSASRDAITLCQAADVAPVSERAVLLASGLARAEEAVKAVPHDAVAHFAVFCNLGKRLQMKSRGWGLLTSLGDLRRARQELDVALALEPDYAAALAAKGQMLTELPRFLGGDRREGEDLLRRAVALQPDDPTMRTMLADVLHTSGERGDASARTAVDVKTQEVSTGQLPSGQALAADAP